MENKKITPKGEKARNALINATALLIAKRGDMSKISLRDISRQAGLTPSMVIYHFRNKKILMDAVKNYVVMNRCSNPLVLYLRQNRELLDSDDGKVMFVAGLIDSFCDFFRKLPPKSWDYSMVYRILLYSDGTRKSTPAYFENDIKAFAEIYALVTGKDDFDMAFFWFSTIFVPLALHLSNHDRNHGEVISRLSPRSSERFIHFCRRQLLAGLGLVGNSDTQALIAAVKKELCKMS